MLTKISILLTGILFIVLGQYLLFNRIHYEPGFSPIDMGSYHWVIGIIFIIGGLFIVYEEIKIIIRDRRKRQPPREDD